MNCPDDAPIGGGGAAAGAAGAGGGVAAGAASLRGAVGSGVDGVPGVAGSGLAPLPPTGIWTAGRDRSPAPRVPPLPSAVPGPAVDVPERGARNASGVSGRGGGAWFLPQPTRAAAAA